jgi:hypothetical protein
MISLTHHLPTDHASSFHHPDEAGWAIRAVQSVMLVSLTAALLLVLFAPVAAHAQLRVNPTHQFDRYDSSELNDSADRSAESLSLSLYRKRAEWPLRKTRYAAAWQAQLGQGPRLAGPLGSWRGELQIIRSTGRGAQPYGSNYRRGLWALKGSALPYTPLEGTTLFAYSKVGLHYMGSAQQAGQQEGLRLGAGAGMAWQISTGAQLNFELNRIGHNVNVVSMGAQIPF